MVEDDLQFGLIGYGAWGGIHGECISRTDGARVAAVCARSEESRARAAADFHDATMYDKIEDLIADDRIDVCDIVVPSDLHHEAACAALQAGKHVLLEKPMALNPADCDSIIETAKRHNRILAVGHELRLSSLWGKMKELIDDGFIGRPLYALVELSRKPYRQGADGWRYDIERVGNWVLEEPIHFFDLARWYMAECGNPTSVYALANSRQQDHPELQDNFSALMRFERDGYAVISQTLSAFEHHQTAKITGTQGALWAGWSGAMDRTLHPTFFLKAFNGESVEEIPIDKITGEVFELEDQIAMMVKAIRDGGPIAASGDDGKWSVAMCLAAQASVDSGTPVDVPKYL